MKKIFSGLLLLTMIIMFGCMTQQASASNVPKELADLGITAFEVDYSEDHSSCQIVSLTVKLTVTKLVIPSEIYGTKVTGIGRRPDVHNKYENVFVGTNEMTLSELELPEEIVSISKNAFDNLTSLKKVTIKGAVKEIPAGAFTNCGLTNVTLPDSVTKIGASAFSGCPLTSISFSSKLKVIGEGAFSDCKSLRKLAIPNGVSILTNAFANTGLKELVIGDKVNLSPDSFAYTNPDSVTASVNNSWVYKKGLVLSRDQKTLICAIRTDKKLIIPSSVRTIGEGACQGKYMTYLEIPKTVKTIKAKAFAYCEKLKSVKIKSKADIPVGCFCMCTKLSKVSMNSSIKKLKRGCFENCKSLKVIILPKQLKSMGAGCFHNATGLKKIILATKNKKFYVKKGCLINQKGVVFVAINKKIFVCPSKVKVLSLGCFTNEKKLKTIKKNKKTTRVEGINGMKREGILVSK